MGEIYYLVGQIINFLQGCTFALIMSLCLKMNPLDLAKLSQNIEKVNEDSFLFLHVPLCTLQMFLLFL